MRGIACHSSKLWTLQVAEPAAAPSGAEQLPVDRLADQRADGAADRPAEHRPDGAED